MAQMKLLLCFLITLTINIPVILSTAPSYLYSICSNTTMFATKSQFETNLNTVFGYLSGNATNPSGFHAAQAGNGTKDFVYAHFLCRGDQVPSSCQDCVTAATTSDLPVKHCPNTKKAIIWYDECMVRYSNVSFLGVLDISTEYVLMNTQNVTGNVSRFMDIMDTMMSSIVHRASNGGPNKKYATNYVRYLGSVGIYGLEQCTPDLTAGDCQQCLQNAVGSLPTSKGGRTMLPSCNVRFEINPFFNGADNLPSLSPSLPPSVSPSPMPSLPPSLQPSLPPSSPVPDESTSNSTGTSISNSGKIETSSTKLIAIIVPTTILIWLTLNLP